MHLRFRDDSAFENVAHEEVIVHRLRDDLRHPTGIELDESVVFRTSRLKRRLCQRGVRCELWELLANLFVS